MTKQTVYGLDSKGNLKVLSVWPEGDLAVQEYGRYGGKLVRKEKQCKAKNTGKANATTAEEQAKLACDRIITKKTEQEFYYPAPTELGSIVTESSWIQALKDYIQQKLASENDAPMLAYPLEKGKKHIDWENGVMVSNKLDGIRCNAVYRNGGLTLKSRKNKPIETMQHIHDALEPWMAQKAADHGGVFRLDGELYNHEYKNNFEDLVSAIKKYKSGTSELVKFYVYDEMNVDKTAWDRFVTYDMLITNILDVNPTAPIESVAQTLAYDQNEVNEFNVSALAQGFEGTMLKNSKSLYKQSRSFDLLKMKQFYDAEYEITDIIPMDADPTQGLYVCKDEKTGKTFKATPKTTIEGKREILNNKSQYIGKPLTVKYFELTSDGIPRFPVGLNVRDVVLQG